MRNRPGITATQLATGLGVTLPTVTSVVDRLAAQGLMERGGDAADRRRVILAVTPAGREIVERIQQGRRARLARALDGLDETSLTALLDGLEALAAAADVVDAAEAEQPQPVTAGR